MTLTSGSPIHKDQDPPRVGMTSTSTRSSNSSSFFTFDFEMEKNSRKSSEASAAKGHDAAMPDTCAHCGKNPTAPPEEADLGSQSAPKDPYAMSKIALASLMIGISLSAFLVALDRTIVANAIPKIVDQFDAPADAGWYGSAYLLTACAFQTIYGRVYAHFDVRWSFITALSFFEVGSLICGVAPNSDVLIVGRAIAGVGCAGIFAGCLVIISIVTPLETRPVYMAAVGSIFGVGSVCGPLIGGVFTSEVSWRWCFYINLPVGAVTVILLLLFFHPKKTDTKAHEGTFMQRILRLDLVGNFIIIVTVLMLLLALQEGGVDWAWSSGKVVGLLMATGIGFAVYGAWQWKMGENALTPLYLLAKRSVLASVGVMFFLTAALLVHTYYLPFWFQAVRARSPIGSGVDLVPYVAISFVFSMVAGVYVKKTGYYTPPAIAGPIVACIGCGLMTTLKVDTSTGVWIAYQIVTGAGMGLAMQQPIIAVQAALEAEMVSIGSAIVLFAQGLAGAIFISVANTILRNELSTELAKSNIPNAAAILGAGATNVRKLVPPEFGDALVEIYNSALQKVFISAIPYTGCALLCSLFLPWTQLTSMIMPGEG